MSEAEKESWLDKLKQFMSGDAALEIVEKLAEMAWFVVLKPMVKKYVEATPNQWDDGVFEKICGSIESMLNSISKTDGD